jgi:hypothetical protein
MEIRTREITLSGVLFLRKKKIAESQSRRNEMETDSETGSSDQPAIFHQVKKNRKAI